jgi:phosphopantothenate-cysteine ligase/phosphopantothenoylcysteine decarboxylase/phosphopantothenate--cysteine ligase
MKILVTTGNTQVPIDRVRCISNIFSGRTGARIATRAFERGHSVVLLASHPEVVQSIASSRPREAPAWRLRPYRTVDDLDAAMAEEFRGGNYDAVIHSAAVSDYRVAGVFADRESQEPLSSGKLKSNHPELWLKLTPTHKIVDRIRRDWGFAGVLVKFKLESGVSEDELLAIAERAREHSAADLMVANTEEGMREWAFVGAGHGGYRKVPRAELADSLLELLEELT